MFKYAYKTLVYVYIYVCIAYILNKLSVYLMDRYFVLK